jgi:RNA polymerase sigma-70 factor (ECF subfamily)
MLRSDEELMLSCRDGDEGAFEILYRRYEKPIFSFIYRMVLSAADAEDLCQETFFKVIRAKKKYRKTAKFKTWLFNIALNLCRDRIRRMKFRSHLSLNSPAFSQGSEEIWTRQLISDSSSDPTRQVQNDEMNTLVQQAFKKLPEQERTVVILRQYHAMKFSEIGEVMNCPLGTAKSLNHRGREKLMKALSKYMEQ